MANEKEVLKAYNAARKIVISSLLITKEMNTEELRKDAVSQLWNSSMAMTKDKFIDRVFEIFKGAEWEAEREKWIDFDSMTKEDKIRFNTHPQKLIICQFDNGDILRYDEDFPVAALVKVILLPKP